MSKHFEKIGNDELYSRQIEQAKKGQQLEAKECQALSEKIENVEADYLENAVAHDLMQEAVQMERMVLSIEQNSLRVRYIDCFFYDMNFSI